MRRRALLVSGAAVATFAASGCVGARSATTFSAGFESGLGRWEADAAIGPEVAIEDFEWTVDISNAEAAEGSRSLRIWNEGDYDDGTTWAVHPVSIRAGRSYDITVTAEFWSESESFNTLRDAVMRLGAEPPDSEADFPQPGMTSTGMGETAFGGLREPLWLADGWREYGFEWTTPELSTDTLYLALGTSVIWEGDATHYVDDVSVEARPR